MASPAMEAFDSQLSQRLLAAQDADRQRSRARRLCVCFTIFNLACTVAAFSSFAYHAVSGSNKSPSTLGVAGRSPSSGGSHAREAATQQTLTLISTPPQEASQTTYSPREGGALVAGGRPRARRKLKKLNKDLVFVISSDGFRYGYFWKVYMANLERLRSNGTESVPGMFPVYPSLTFPNHYSIATGLYPVSHGIVANKFTDPSTGEKFRPGVLEAKWWLGEPIWETVVKNGLLAATMFWPGSDVSKGAWNCTLPYCHIFDSTVPYERRIDDLLKLLDLPEEEQPSLIMLYLDEADYSGHTFGPDDPHIDHAITFVDQMLGRILGGLDERGIFDDVSIFFVSDHGMVGTCDEKIIFLEDFQPWVNISAEWADTLTPILTLRPPAELSAEEVYQNMTAALSSGSVEKGEFLKVYRREDLPARLHYSDSDRVQPIIGIVAEGYAIELSRPANKGCEGTHGYDNTLLSMRATFVAHGPHFEQGRKIPAFNNLEVYNVIASILGIEGAPNNGTSSFPTTILLPEEASESK